MRFNGASGASVSSTADVPDSTDRRYCTDAQKTVISNTSGTNTGDQTSTSGLTDSIDKRFCTDAQKTVIGNTSGTNTGDQTSVSGNAGTATKLATARAINGVNFDGSAAITVPNVQNSNGGSSGDVVTTLGSSLADGSVNAGAKLISVGTGVGGSYTEKIYVNKAGSLVPVVDSGSDLGSSSHRWGDAYLAAIKDLDSDPRAIFTNNGATDIIGNLATGVAGAGVRIANSDNRTTAGDLICSFHAGRESTAAKNTIDKDGTLEMTGAGVGIVLKSPDGTRYRLTVANGGTLSIAPA